ncbi:phospholipid/cholesterol/gamma-HCH transport system permease protein [Limimaricola soesokkakensis]|uniref:Phospholipid/cholesterol/gamma-HCH transport system permease protein n=1 Tax=Limimaricola soesokkakensis TaxID=1343159 RepID=A0A1X6Z3W8_9RHOB|nr:MlaE family lipid ABC transporter permease subunit [Limimaricola soesokkakensis]PSK81821.1 phospholipid/cholesterol/gamma-HCH transport system permease protein [Limimaricola soesokkakensis]SLN39312.1 putative phospholipid ABC transporter permease protein MlaE [Limimaricola soesokkakensis]
MSIKIGTTAGQPKIEISGSLGLPELEQARRRFAQTPFAPHATLDLSALQRLDSAGAWLLLTEQARLRQEGTDLIIASVPPHALPLVEVVRANLARAEPATRPPLTVAALLDRLGRKVAGGAAFLRDLLGYLGIFTARLLGALRRPRGFHLTSLVHHCEEVGLRAVPIVALMAFLIGVVLAFQGATQLRPFGAEIFVVELIAISILRELGILLTAIIVAGRTASAFTAAIGSMKMREEIDAMLTLRIDPANALILPRILALVITLPILGLVADLSGLLGGALMSWAELGISPAMFRTRLIEGVEPIHVVVGLVKAPVFALIIGIVGCRAGMQVGNSAESLGRMTSSAVVTAIFAVIVIDALFSILFAQVGL